MERKNVIKRTNLPTRLPVYQTLTLWMALRLFKAPQWMWGAAGLYLLILWIATVVVQWKEKEVDLLKNNDQ